MSSTVDWQEVRQRLAAGDAALARVLEVTDERFEALLRERTRRLAMPDLASGSRIAATRVLVARSGSERYALPLARLAGVVPFARWTPVAGAPAAMIGVFNGRGAIWAAFDLHRLLSANGSPEATDGGAVLLRHPHRRIALRVDEISDLRDFRRVGTASSAPVAGGEIVTEVTSDGVMLLDVDALWAHPSIGEAG